MSRDYSTEDVRRRPPGVVVVEALGASFFASGHIPAAINIPPHEVANLAPTALPDRSARIVVYANGSSSNATIVLQQLAHLGYHQLALYVDGTEGWIEAGLPVD